MIATREGPAGSAAAGAAPPRVYVLLLNWRGWADTIECLESVFRQRYGNFRVVVCDNDSPDDSVERIRTWAEGRLLVDVPQAQPLRRLSLPPVAKPIPLTELDRDGAARGGEMEVDRPLTLIRTGGNLGFAGGNNIGIRYALARGDADYIWLLNNDTVVDPDALAVMVERARRDDRAGVVGAKLLYYDDPQRVQAIAGGRLTAWKGMATHLGAGVRDDERWTSPIELDVILGACLLIRREVIEEIGLLDEAYFMYSEELDWCWRARRRGWKLLYAPGSVVWHKVGRSVGQRSTLQEYHAARGTLLFMRKHFPRLLPVAFVYGLYRTLLPKLLRVQPARAKAVLRAYRDAVRGVAPSRTGSA
jgi:GT2 family glycosyltransferase